MKKRSSLLNQGQKQVLQTAHSLQVMSMTSSKNAWNENIQPTGVAKDGSECAKKTQFASQIKDRSTGSAQRQEKGNNTPCEPGAASPEGLRTPSHTRPERVKLQDRFRVCQPSRSKPVHAFRGFHEAHCLLPSKTLHLSVALSNIFTFPNRLTRSHAAPSTNIGGQKKVGNATGRRE